MKIKEGIVPVIFVFAALILFAGQAKAVFSINANSSFIEPSYLEGEFVRGRINVSFSQQDNADFTGNFKGGADLSEVLRAMNLTAADYSCDPINCESDYSAAEHTGAETQDLELGDKNIYGFVINQKFLGIANNGFRFNVTANAIASCTNQIAVDLFDDGSVDFYNTQATGDCVLEPENYGCFDADEVSDSVLIGGADNLYCELIKDIPPAPGYRLGAKVSKADSTSAGSIGFVMYSPDGTKQLGESGVTVNPGSNANVTIDYSSLEEFDALVCVWAASNPNSYEIRVNEEDEDICGFKWNLESQFDATFDVDYEIYARPLAYATINQIEFSEKNYEEATGRKLVDDLENYINYTYKNNCTGRDGCVIPFGLWGKTSDGQKLDSAKLLYDTPTGIKSTNQTYLVNSRPPRITSKRNLMLDVEKMKFVVPNSNGNFTFILKFNGNNLLSKPIRTDIGFDFTIAPRFAFIGRGTSFNAVTNFNVSRGIWDFGDGTVEQFDGKSAQHTYAKAGEFDVKVTLTKQTSTNLSQSTSTKKFKVLVGDAKTSANLTLKDYESRIVNVRANIATLPEWIKASAETSLDLTNVEAVVKAKRTEYNQKAGAANTVDADYLPIINSLLETKVPASVYVKNTGTLPAEIGFNGINPSYIATISNSQEINSGAAKSEIISWMSKNYEMLIEFQTLSAVWDFDETTDVLKSYKLNLISKPGAESVYSYLIIGQPKNSVKFKTTLDAKEAGTGTYIGFESSDAPSSVEFLIAGSEAPSVENLGVYISPDLSSLNVEGRSIRQNWWQDEEGNFNWTRFLVGMIIILLAVLIVYLILQAWYKKYYERRLFKNPNDLYNLLNFIYNSRKSGLKDEEIKSKLKEKKWTGEQITYAFNKIDGKRTGMWEIPIFKFVENKKVIKEIEKKQKKPVDVRFIKRPSF